ncbi:hypothetical protein [Nocardia sputorum]|uniref:Uncharacterized protein n=1 Tax=Nocardia sputorum TaxID=2984338 RepID=A0ABM8CYM2_9NOCA|nr:hypothetical protein [Nocardia sputorum]BDU00111.1 hypothetical protein IFM12276_31390 [Nocardia sputorum]
MTGCDLCLYRSVTPGLPGPGVSFEQQMLAGIERREDSDGSDHRMLRRTLRATAAVSLSEVEWTRRMRATGSVLQPRVSVVDGYVAGYIVQWRDPRSARLGPAITDLEVGAGLSLPDLRDGWEPDAHAVADAQTEWKHPRSVAPSARETVVSGDTEFWTHALADVRSFTETLARVPSTDRAAWRWAASRVSGVLAIWSWRVEPDARGPFADAAHEVGMSALAAGSRIRPPSFGSHVPDLGQAAFVLAQLCREVHDPSTESNLVGALITSIAAIIKAHRERGEMARASSIYATAVGPLKWIEHDIRTTVPTSVIGCQLRLGHVSPSPPG